MLELVRGAHARAATTVRASLVCGEAPLGISREAPLRIGNGHAHGIRRPGIGILDQHVDVLSRRRVHASVHATPEAVLPGVHPSTLIARASEATDGGNDAAVVAVPFGWGGLARSDEVSFHGRDLLKDLEAVCSINDTHLF